MQIEEQYKRYYYTAIKAFTYDKHFQTMGFVMV